MKNSNKIESFDSQKALSNKDGDTNNKNELKTGFPFPKIVILIIIYKIFESLSYSGTKAVLFIFLKDFNGLGEDTATSLYHAFLLFGYISTLGGT
jgi:dipeptide/tripeptide permease